MHKRPLAKILFLIAALPLLLIQTSLSLAQAANEHPNERPNIVILVADDIGYADPGFRGSDIETPSIDSLAADGIEIRRFYSAPICSPTRAALMTGRDPIRLGVAFGVVLPWDSGGVHSSEHFMPESFRAAGYQTAMIGKWHLGHAQQQLHPNNRGFDHFYGHMHTEVGYYPPFSMMGGKDFQENGKSINVKSGEANDKENYETYLLADHASNWIENRDKDKPFFLYLPFISPHEPLEAPGELIDKYKNLEDKREPSRGRADAGATALLGMATKSRRPLYAAVVHAMDQAIGRVLDTLKKEGIADNTIVLFFSDNGASRLTGRGGGDNAPLRGGKAEVYEGGIRVASLMRWPKKIKASSKTEQVMTVMDVFPTLAAAASIEAQNSRKFDGINMLPALTEDKEVTRQSTIFFGSEIPRYGSFNITAFNEVWKLIQWTEQEPTSVSVSYELFKIKEDPYEYHNLGQQFPEIVQAMAREIRQWRALYPINGIRARISVPPGWIPPLDWADYPRPVETLQAKPIDSVAPTKASEQILDFNHGERGRLIYDCEPVNWMAGVCLTSNRE